MQDGKRKGRGPAVAHPIGDLLRDGAISGPKPSITGQDLRYRLVIRLFLEKNKDRAESARKKPRGKARHTANRRYRRLARSRSPPSRSLILDDDAMMVPDNMIPAPWHPLHNTPWRSRNEAIDTEALAFDISAFDVGIDVEDNLAMVREILMIARPRWSETICHHRRGRRSRPVRRLPHPPYLRVEPSRARIRWHPPHGAGGQALFLSEGRPISLRSRPYRLGYRSRTERHKLSIMPASACPGHPMNSPRLATS